MPLYRDRRKRIPSPSNPDSTIPGPWSTADTVPLPPGAWIGFGTSIAVGDAARSQVVTTATLYGPPGMDVKAGDRVRDGDATWQVNVVPMTHRNPFTGAVPTMEIPLEGVTG